VSSAGVLSAQDGPERIPAVLRVGRAVADALHDRGLAVLPPLDARDALAIAAAIGLQADTTMLDPWYNKGVGGVRDDYLPAHLEIIRAAGALSDHVFFWGFPEIVAPFVERIPPPLTLTCWLTWYYKNNPSVIRGWRSSQNACLHLSRPGAPLHPERFLTPAQLDLRARGKLRYMPGPTSVLDDGFDPDLDRPADVIEHPLLVGFVGRAEQTGHPSQKPFKVYERLLLMTVPDGGLVLDPMCGSGTAGAVAAHHGLRAVLCDGSDAHLSLAEARLGVRRLPIEPDLAAALASLPKT
jgi:site-specific DNA-methyltransferase (adenine-specific)